MIPAQPGLVACYGDRISTTHTTDVIAWDDDGRALVLNPGQKHLVLASDFPNFLHIDEKETPPTVGAVGGQGWHIEVTQDDGTLWCTPVVAFAIDDTGYATPLAQEQDGGGIWPYKDALSGDKLRLVPPGSAPTHALIPSPRKA